MEVVIAVGVFAVAVTVMLALLPALTRQNTDTADALVAQRLPDALRVELRRVASSDFNALAAAIPVMTAPLINGLALVAARDGNRLHTMSYQPPAAGASIPPGEQYFLVETWRFNQPPLAYDRAASVLVVYARVSWPYSNSGSVAPTALADRDQFTFLVSINR
ncbi:MAG: hypothetical protein JWQ83_1845 [Lacunisphaera sp.]|nr:hypothetical protein [Lacunisphaera sp.]